MIPPTSLNGLFEATHHLGSRNAACLVHEVIVGVLPIVALAVRHARLTAVRSCAAQLLIWATSSWSTLRTRTWTFFPALAV